MEIGNQIPPIIDWSNQAIENHRFICTRENFDSPSVQLFMIWLHFQYTVVTPGLLQKNVKKLNSPGEFSG